MTGDPVEVLIVEWSPEHDQEPIVEVFEGPRANVEAKRYAVALLIGEAVFLDQTDDDDHSVLGEAGYEFALQSGLEFVAANGADLTRWLEEFQDLEGAATVTIIQRKIRNKGEFHGKSI